MEGSESRLEMIRETLTCVHNLHFFEYDETFTPIYSSMESPHDGIFHMLFGLDVGDRMSPDHVTEYGKPSLQINSMGLAWIAEAESLGGKVKKIHVMGPVFLDDFSFRSIDEKLRAMQVSINIKKQVMMLLKEVPVVSLLRFYEYGIMYHFCLTGERITMSEFSFHNDDKEEQRIYDMPGEKHGTYMAEQQILGFVEEGNIYYREKMDKLISFGNMVPTRDVDYLRQAKNSVIMFVALCTRAAIRGGLPSETAYSISDRYLKNVEADKTIQEVTEDSHAMMEEFVQRVHRVKLDKGISPAIQKCCDYICLHPEEKLDVHMLAEKVGYTDYYFSKRFKKEVGLSVREYITNKKIEKAEELLRNTSLSIQDISEMLGYSAQSYFGDVFRKLHGISPSEFRMRQDIKISKNEEEE